tara:strand:- start:167 stop:538 length:372 start_codon:yes stop_codon:yes gene_type:complete
MVHGVWKISHRATLTNRPQYQIMGGLAPSVGVSATTQRAYREGNATTRQGMISGQPSSVTIPIIHGGLPNRVGLKTMCQFNLLSVNPQCSGGVGRRSFVCRSKGTSSASGAVKKLRECSLIGV